MPKVLDRTIGALLRSAFLVCLSLPLPSGSCRASAAVDETPRRLLIRLPDGLEPVAEVSFEELRSFERGAIRPAGRLSIRDAWPLSSQLELAGAVAMARLNDGLSAAPSEWSGWYVVGFSPPLVKREATQLAANLRAVEPRVRVEVETIYETLELPGARRSLEAPAAALPGAGGGFAGLQSAGARTGFFPDDPYLADGTQWGLFNEGSGPVSSVPDLDVRAPEAWSLTTGNTNLAIGVVDTGVDDTHPDLFRPLAGGEPRLLYEGVVSGDGSGGRDQQGHGTQVTGVLAALTNNGATLDGKGVAGVVGGSGGDSLGARLVSIKVTYGGGSSASDADMARAVVDAHLLGARVVNLSFAGPEPSDFLRQALAYVADRGTIVVCGAGNSANSVLQYPGSYSRFGLTLSAGALAPDGSLAVFSTRGDQLDVVAPGQEIVSTWLTYANAAGSPLRNYAVNSGTSFAAPFVTGTLGLASTLGADLRANDYQEVVRRTARDLGDAGRDSLFGSGLLDAEALLQGLLPPRALRHGTAAAQSWRMTGRESLSIRSSGLHRLGISIDGEYEADVWEVSAGVGGQIELLETPGVWARYTGSGGWSPGRIHEYDYGWGELVPGSERPDGFDLRTLVYYVDQPPPGCPGCAAIGWVPRPPEQVAMDWTAWARFDAPPALVVLEPAPQTVWTAGQKRIVRWSASDPDRVTRVEASWFDGATERFLGESSDSVGTLEVTVPCRAAPGDPLLRVTAFDAQGLATDQTTVDVAVQLDGVGCDGAPLYLSGPTPNPARGAVHFSCWAPSSAKSAFQFHILDSRGREVARVPIARSSQPMEVSWDGRDRHGRLVPSGVYHAVLDGLGERRAQSFVWFR